MQAGMLHFDRWTLSGTLSTLSHPERARTTALHAARIAMETEAMKKVEGVRRKLYAEAYQQLIDSMNDINDGSTGEDRVVYSFRIQNGVPKA